MKRTKSLNVGAFAAVAAGNVAILGLGIVSGIVSARSLGPTGRGQYFAAFTIAGVLGVVLSLGIVQALVTSKEADTDRGRPLVSQIGVASAFATLVFIVLHMHSSFGWLSVWGIAGATTIMAGGLMSSISGALAQRHGHMTRVFQSARLWPQLIPVLGMLTLATLNQRDPNVWLLIGGAGTAVPSALRLVAQTRSVNRGGSWLPSRRFALSALALAPAAIGGTLVYRLDVVVIAFAARPEAIADYAIAVAACNACFSLGSSSGMITFSRLRDVSDKIARWELISRNLRRAMLMTITVALPATLFADPLINLAFGQQFHGAVGPTRFLTLAAVAMAADYLLCHALIAVGGQFAALRVQLMAAGATLLLLSVVIPRYSLTVVAGVSLIIYSMTTVLYLIAVRKLLRALPG